MGRKVPRKKKKYTRISIKITAGPTRGRKNYGGQVLFDPPAHK